MIFNQDDPTYKKIWLRMGRDRYNGAYYYALELTKFFVPTIRTDRNWILLNWPGKCADHSIVFIHNNVNPSVYNWMKKYDDLVLVCSNKDTMNKVSIYGKPIYLPLSVDVEEVEKYKREKTRKIAYVGRLDKKKYGSFPLPSNVDIIGGMPRMQMLYTMAQYEQVYAVGRVAIEAKILNCEVLPFDKRYPDPSIWPILDSRDAVKILQKELYKVDGY